MADKTITQLTELTSVDKDDILLIIDDPSGTPISKKVKAQNVLLSANTLTANTGVLITDKLVMIDDPSGSPSMNNATVANIFKGAGHETNTNTDVDNNGVFTTSVASGSGILIVSVPTDSITAMYRVEGSTLTSISSNALFSTTKDTASKYNVYFETTEYKVQNKVADNKKVFVTFIGSR